MEPGKRHSLKSREVGWLTGVNANPQSLRRLKQPGEACPMKMDRPHFPGRPPIDAYGNGGFRFADMSHKGSLLILPSGVYPWSVTDAGKLVVRDFAPLLREADDFDLLLLGLGDTIVAAPEPVRQACLTAGVALEAMSTGAAARTYNVLLAEDRAPAAALIAVSGG